MGHFLNFSDSKVSLGLVEHLKSSILFLQSISIRRPPAPVPWIIVNPNGESCDMKTENEQFNLLDKVGSISR